MKTKKLLTILQHVVSVLSKIDLPRQAIPLINSAKLLLSRFNLRQASLMETPVPKCQTPLNLYRSELTVLNLP